MAGSEPQPAPAVATVRRLWWSRRFGRLGWYQPYRRFCWHRRLGGSGGIRSTASSSGCATMCFADFPCGYYGNDVQKCVLDKPNSILVGHDVSCQEVCGTPCCSGADAEGRWKTVLSGQCAHIRPQPRHRVQPTSPRHASHRRKPAEVLRTVPVRRDNIVSSSVSYARRAAIVLTTSLPVATSTVGDRARAGRFQPAHSAVDRPKLYAAAME